MKRLLILGIALSLLVTACVPTPPPLDGSTAANPQLATDAPRTHHANETAEGTALAVDPAVRIGVLDNGLTYYIRENSQPENRAELRLAINAGSILEAEDQLGLAHFLEHMLFNGTERFPEQELIEFMESIGMEFGPDVNAYTSYDETVYMLQIPTDDDAIITKGFEVLEEWAGHALIEPDEVEKERGVIIEEWRMREQNASGRLREQIFPVILSNSHYAERSPIGDTEIINNAPASAIHRYYKDWYRPDLMAVVAVGDFDADAIEAQIHEHFSRLPKVANAPERATFDVPEHDETQYLVATDPEFPLAQVIIFFRRPGEPLTTDVDYRKGLVGQLFSEMLNFRFEEISRQADAPFLFAGTGEGSFVRAVSVAQVFAQVNDDEIERGLDAMLIEVERARQHGFTATELARAKQNMLRAYETAYNERNDTDSANFAGEYVNHYLEQNAIPGIAAEYELVQALLPEITVEEVNERVTSLVGEKNRSVIVIAPEKEGLIVPTEDDLAAVIDDVLATEVEAYVDEEVEGELLAAIPAPAAVVEELTIDELGVTDITLENGVRVLMKPTDFQEDQIVFSAVSPGGSSLVSDEDFPEMGMITAVIAQSGVGDFDESQLAKLLAGKDVGVSPQIYGEGEGFAGSSSTADLETLFQLIHAYATVPRIDEDAFEAYRNQQRAFIENRELEPFTALSDLYVEKVFDNHPRVIAPTLELIDGLDLARGFELYQERFADMGDFTFTFVGNFDVAELTALAQTYLGTLPAAGRVEEPIDVMPDAPEGIVVEGTAYKGQDELSAVQLVFHSLIDPTRANRMTTRMLGDLLGLRLREELREELGGVYFAQSFAQVEIKPDQKFSLVVFFTTDPNRVDELVDTVFAEIAKIRADGPDPDDVATIKAQTLSSREESLEDNGFWVSQLEFYVEHPDEDMLDILTFDELVESISVEDIQQMAQAQILDEQYIRVVLLPESYAP